MLKGLNRPVFENRLLRNIRHALSGLGKVSVYKSQSRMYIEPEDSTFNFDKAAEKLSVVFGIVSISIAEKIDTDIDIIRKTALEQFRNIHDLKTVNTFKIETKRGKKSFPLKSTEISADIGAYILENTEGISVNVHNPDITIYIEVRESTFVYSGIIRGCGGMPTGTGGKVILLLSGGIDSPLAGWMTARRGVVLEAVHFYSYPYTSERSKQKVITLAEILAAYCGNIKLHVVPFTEIQLELSRSCPGDYLTILMRRAMYKIADRIAAGCGALAVVTGESIGQVASQTLQAISVTDEACTMPVFRPLIGMDKNDVVDAARKIGTYDTSIMPYEDCCTVFVAKHPRTRPTLTRTVAHEEKASLDRLIEEAVAETEIINVKGG